LAKFSEENCGPYFYQSSYGNNNEYASCFVKQEPTDEGSLSYQFDVDANVDEKTDEDHNEHSFCTNRDRQIKTSESRMQSVYLTGCIRLDTMSGSQLGTDDGTDDDDNDICNCQSCSASDAAVHPETAAEHRLTCMLCDKSFNCATKLKYHLHSHMSRQPFSCGICKKMFSILDNLKAHMRIHARTTF